MSWQPYRALVATWLIVAFAACAEGSGSLPIPQSGQTAPVADHKGKLALHIRVPHARNPGFARQAHARKPHYVSVATRALTLEIDGPTSVPSEVIGLRPSSPGCKSASGYTSCALTVPGLQPCPSKANCYSATIVTYDAYDASNNTIPASANELSAAQKVGFTIITGQTYAIAITLGGIPASAIIDPLPSSTMSGTMASGFTEDRCFAADSVNVYGVDADGNDIMGPGAPKPSLSSDDPVHMAVSTPAPSAPNTFVLTRPPQSVPTPGSIVHLTAGVKPAADSGGSSQSAVATVTFDSNESCGIIGTITEYSLTQAASGPGFITTGPDKALWFANQSANGNSIGRITTNGVQMNYPLSAADSKPVGIAAGSDGALWFTEETNSKIGRITTGGSITEYSQGLSSSSYPYGITAGPDGALWFAELLGNRIGRITTDGTITEYSLPNPSVWPYDITAGPDGALWFTEVYGANYSTASHIGRITTDGKITEYSLGTDVWRSPYGITTGPDGALWFTEENADRIGRITTSGTITEYSVPTGKSQPYSIVTGSDGALWFTEYAGDQIGRITTDGNVNEKAVPGASPSLTFAPYGIAAGPDGALWFTEYQGNAIGRI